MASKVALAFKLPPRTELVPDLASPAKKVLPSAVFKNVLSFLETRTDGPNVALTCKAWVWLTPKCTLGCLDTKLFDKIGDQCPTAKPEDGDCWVKKPETHVAACHARFKNVRAIDLRELSLYTNNIMAIFSLLFTTYPTCSSFAYPRVEGDHFRLEGTPLSFQERVNQSLKGAFGGLPSTLRVLDMSIVFMDAERVFSYVQKNPHLTCLTLQPVLILGRDADKSARNVQSIACKFPGLRRVEIMTVFRYELPAELCTYILQGLPGLEVLSLVNLNVDRRCGVGIPFTHEPNAPLEENRPQNKSLKRVEFTSFVIDQEILDLFARSCVTPPQVSFHQCTFARTHFNFSVQLLPQPKEERKPERKSEEKKS